MAQCLKTLAMIQVHDLSEGHEAPIGYTYGHARQSRQTLALIPGQLHPHFHLITSVLKDLGYPAIKRRPQLASQVRCGEAQRLAIGTGLIDQLFTAPRHVVFHIQHTGQRR